MAETVDADGVFENKTPGLYALADLPQRGSVAKQAFGVGWPELDDILKFYLGQFVVVSGVAGHGKSTFVLNALVKLAREKGVKSFMYVPENEGHLFEKLRLIWPGSDESFSHFAANQCFVQSAVPYFVNEPPHTLDWVLARPIREGAVFLVRWMRPNTSSDEAHRIAFGFSTA